MKRYAGPFKEIPFQNFVQSPIGLVPKDGGHDTHLIIHLSYPVNSQTPKEKCSVKYPDFEEAIKRCMEEEKLEDKMPAFVGKSDLKSAFRFVPIRKLDWMLLIMKARNPEDNQWYYFVDKCMPFGGSISCAHFQEISDALAHIQKFRSGKQPINYLDDFLFAALCRALCDDQMDTFMQICKELGIPVWIEKTKWGSTCMVFLGLLIDTVNRLIEEQKI